MRFRTALTAVLLSIPTLLRSTGEESIRGFDMAAREREVEWEKQARGIPEAARIGATIRRLSSQPHLAGTPQSKQTAETILAALREYGLDAKIEPFEAMLPTPKERVLEITGPNGKIAGSNTQLGLEEARDPGRHSDV